MAKKPVKNSAPAAAVDNSSITRLTVQITALQERTRKLACEVSEVDCALLGLRYEVARVQKTGRIVSWLAGVVAALCVAVLLVTVFK